MARKLSALAGHGCWTLAVAAALLAASRAPAEDQVKVHTRYAEPATIDNPFVGKNAPARLPEATAPPKVAPRQTADTANRYVSPPGMAWRAPAGRLQRPPISASASEKLPPFDPFDVSSGVAIISDVEEEPLAADKPAVDAPVASGEKAAGGLPEISFSAKASDVSIGADTPVSCFAGAVRVARHADSLGEISSVIRLCRQGLQYDSSPEEAASLRRLAAWAYNRRGEFQIAAGRENDAMQDFQAAIRFDPKCAQALLNRGITYAQRGQAEGALRDLDRALEANPGLAIAHRNRGELLASLGRTEDAVRDYGEAIVQSPQDAELYKMRGHAFHRLGEFDKAVIDLSRAIELAPADAEQADAAGAASAADAYTLRGNVQAERGKFKLALRDYQQALKIDARWADAYRSKAWLLATCPDPQVRNPGRALVAARQAMKLTGPDDTFVLEALAAAYASNGNFDEAIRSQRRAVDQAAPGLAEPLRERLALYQHRRPLVNRPSAEIQPASHETAESAEAPQLVD